MQPGSHNYELRRGDSFVLAFRLKTRDLVSQVTELLPLAGNLVTFTLQLPGGPVTKTTAPGGGLTVGAGDVISWAMAPADTAGLPASAPYTVRVDFGDGWRATYLAGNLIALG